MNKILMRGMKGLVFFAGWLLSPFTWWNDFFVNIPLSYFIANFLFYISHFPFRWLMTGALWFTNILGLILMLVGGRGVILSSRDKKRSFLLLVTALLIYTVIMTWLDKHGKLVPLNIYFERYCIPR